MQDHYADYFTMGAGNGKPGGGVYQGSESAYGDCTRRSTASNETGDAGTLVRHRVGYGDDGVRTDGKTAGRAGAFHRQRVGDEMKPHPRPLSFREGRKGG